MATRFNYSRFRTIKADTMQKVNFPVFSYLKTRKKELNKATTRIAELKAEIDKLNDELIRQRNIITKAQRILKQL